MDPVYEEINETSQGEVDDFSVSSWSEDIDDTEDGMNAVDSDHDYMTTDKEYENTKWTVYENSRESEGYQDPVCSGQKDEKTSKTDQDGYEIPVKTKRK